MTWPTQPMTKLKGVRSYKLRITGDDLRITESGASAKTLNN